MRAGMAERARRNPAWRCRRRWRRCVAAALLALVALPAAHAHLMVAQRGTLNLVGSGGFVVMSVPVQALQGVDDDGDGRLSLAEMRAHASSIEAQVLRGLQLVGDAGPLPLEGLMLNLSPDDSASTAPAAHLVVMGRFAIADGSPQALSRLKLRFTLFGKTAETQQQTITVSRGSEAQKMVLSPGHDAGVLFPSPWTVLRDNAALGAEHVLSGLDHMLFLLVVLATGWGWRRTALALTVFTAGHAISLAAVAIGGLQRAGAHRRAGHRRHHRRDGTVRPLVPRTQPAAGARLAPGAGLRLRVDSWPGPGGGADQPGPGFDESAAQPGGIQRRHRSRAARRCAGGWPLHLRPSTLADFCFIRHIHETGRGNSVVCTLAFTCVACMLHLGGGAEL